MANQNYTLNLMAPRDLLAEALAGEQSASTEKKKDHHVHIRVQQRNGRKSITTCQGLRDDLDFPRLIKEFKKRWGCNGSVVDDTGGKVIQLQGDQRENLKEFFVTEKLAKADNIKMYGL